MAKKKNAPTRDYTEIIEKITKLREEATKTARDGMLLGFKEIFDAYPTLTSLGWRQATPYFNDGDECVFSAHIDSYSLIVNGYDADYGDEDEDQVELPEELHEEIADEVAEFLSNFVDEDFKSIYGDHVVVTVYRDGRTETREYNHD
jgi:hypothetical protein